MPGDVRSLVVGAAAAVLALTLVLPLIVAPRRLATLLLFGIFLGGVALAWLSRSDFVFFAGWGLSALGAWGIGRLETRSRTAAAFPLGAAGLFGTTLLVGAVALRQPPLAALGNSGLTTALAALGGLLAVVGLVAPLADRSPSAGLDVVPALLVGPAALAIGVWPVVRLGQRPSPDALILALGVLAVCWLLASSRRPDIWSLLADLTLGALCVALAGFAIGNPSSSTLVTGAAISGIVCLMSLALVLAEIGRRSGRLDIASLGGHAADSPLLAPTAGAAGLLLVVDLAALGSTLLPAALVSERIAGEVVTLLPAIATALTIGTLFGGVFGGEPRARREPRHSRLASLLIVLFVVATGVGLVTFPELIIASLARGS